MKRGLSGRLVLDGSALVDAVFSSPSGVRLVEVLEKELVIAYTTELGIAELRYVVCRKLGLKESKERVDKLLASGYVQVEDVSGLIEDTARLKCERAISLADCFCLALARKNGCGALFARRESDLIKEMRKKPFDVEVLFLEDYFK